MLALNWDSWDNIDDDTRQRWQGEAGKVTMHLINIRQKEDGEDLLHKVDMALKESRHKAGRVHQTAGFAWLWLRSVSLISCAHRPGLQQQVKSRMADVCLSLEKARKDLLSAVRRYQLDQMRFKLKDAQSFQSYMSNELRIIQHKLVEEDALLETRDIAFTIPDADWMQKQPDFTKTAVELVSDGRATPKDIKEFQARSFLMNMMLGQVMDRAAKLAEQAYNKVMLPAFDKIGACFCMSGKAFYQELQDFIKGSAAKGKIPQDNEDVLIDFVDREHFKLMYMGCVLWSALPLAYSDRGSKKNGVQPERGVQTAVPEEPRYDPAMFVFYGQRPWQNQHGNV